MSKIITFRGVLSTAGPEDKLRVKTNNGKTGYKIVKFQILSTKPGSAAANEEMIVVITSRANSTAYSTTVDFTNSDLIAVAYQETVAGAQEGLTTTIIFDNVMFNQDVFVGAADASGGTTPINYYIELEAIPLSDIEATRLTLQNIKMLTSQ
jgi:hypothetical protein